MISTQKLIDELEEIKQEGFQVSCRMGLLNTTKAVYIYQSQIFLFNMEDKFSFKKGMGYSRNEFLEEYGNYYWLIEETIS